jgi:hypothetical protein
MNNKNVIIIIIIISYVLTQHIDNKHVCMFHVANYWRNSGEIWYECYTVGSQPINIAVGNNTMVDT